MTSTDSGIRLSYVSVDSGDGQDPRAEACRILRELRVLAGLRDATEEWSVDDGAAVLEIPLTEDRRVLTLSSADAVETSLTTRELREAFAGRGLTLWLQDDDEHDDDDADDGNGDEDDDAAAEDFDDSADDDLWADEEVDAELFRPIPVRVAAFSHRGPVWARIIAELNRSRVAYVESGEWSLQLYASSEPSNVGAPSRAESPAIEWNRPAHGRSWFEVSITDDALPVVLQVDAARGTRPVLDMDEISDEQTTALYRRLLTEGDGSRDELVALSERVHLNVDAAHRALMPEDLGGVTGTEAREREFLLAFGVPRDLVAVASSDDVAAGQIFEPVGWGAAAAESLVGGLAEWAPLTRRGTPVQRFTRWLAERPLLGIAIAIAESTAGFWMARRLRGAGRGIGIMLMIDALADLAVWIVRISRRR